MKGSMIKYHEAFKIYIESVNKLPIRVPALEYELAYKKAEEDGASPFIDRCWPLDYLYLIENIGLNHLEVTKLGEDKYGTIHDYYSLIHPSDAYRILDDGDNEYPTAFLIFTTGWSGKIVYMRGKEGVGIYNIPIEYGEDSEYCVYIGKSFTSVFLEGEGIDKLGTA